MDRPSNDTPGWRAARRLGEWYQRQALSQVEVARLIGMHQPHVSAVLRGLKALSAKHFDRVAAVMAIPVSDLIAAEDAAVWDQEDWPVVAQVHELPPDVRRAFIDQWRAALDAYRRGQAHAEMAAGTNEDPKESQRRRRPIKHGR